MNNEEWNAHNGLLQQAYRAYLHAVEQKEKDTENSERTGMASFRRFVF